MAVGSARRAVISAAHALVAERAAATLRIARAERMAGGVDAAEGRAAIGVPQALRRHRRSVGARTVAARLTERAVGRGGARRVALPSDADAALAAGRVVVAEHHRAGAARIAAIRVAAPVGARLIREARIGRAARRHAVADVADQAAGAVAVDLAHRRRDAARSGYRRQPLGRRWIRCHPWCP